MRLRTPAIRGPFFFSLARNDSIQETTKRVRVNRQIRISPVRVIGADSSQLGIMEVDTALRMADDIIVRSDLDVRGA